MDKAMNVLNNLTGNLTNDLKSCMIGRIEKYDAEKMKAEVLPLVREQTKSGETEELQLLIEVPVALLKAGPFVIRPPYKVGDIVVIAFADSDIDNALLTGEVSDPNSKRKHSLDDAIIISGIMPFTQSLPSEHAEDLIIANEDFTTKVVLKENGDIIIQGSKVLLGNESAIEGVPLGITLKDWLDSHTHPYNWTDPGGSSTTSPPATPSPDPSEVVKTI